MLHQKTHQLAGNGHAEVSAVHTCREVRSAGEALSVARRGPAFFPPFLPELRGSGESLHLSVPLFLYLEKGGDGSPGRLSRGACWQPRSEGGGGPG